MHTYKTVATDAWGSVFEDEVWAESPYKAANIAADGLVDHGLKSCLLYTSPSPRDS